MERRCPRWHGSARLWSANMIAITCTTLVPCAKMSVNLQKCNTTPEMEQRRYIAEIIMKIFRLGSVGLYLFNPCTHPSFNDLLSTYMYIFSCINSSYSCFTYSTAQAFNFAKGSKEGPLVAFFSGPKHGPKRSVVSGWHGSRCGKASWASRI